LTTTIQIKRRTTGSAGAPASLASGEIAFNEVDSTLYYGAAAGIVPIAGSGATVGGAFYGSTDRRVSWASGYSLSFSATANAFTFNCNANPSASLNLNTTNAYKIGGGPWSSISDRRIKNVHEKYAGGLSQIEQLQPVVYSYKANDSAPGVASLHDSAAASGKKLIGLVAQECETHLPEMVTKSAGFIDGVAVSDLRALDTGPLLYAMLNAIKELSQRLRAAEAKVTKLEGRT